MNKNQVYQFLTDKKIPYEVVDHPAVFTVTEADALNLPHPEARVKNLFLRDDKKQNYYLFTVRENLSVHLKDFQTKIGSRRLSFASETDLMEILRLQKGAVTPFGIMNDNNRIVQVFFDSFYRGGMISVHPNDNTATVYIPCDELMKLIHEHGNTVEYITIGE